MTATLVYPAGSAFGLMGVLTVVLLAPSSGSSTLSRRLAEHRLDHGIPSRGSGLRAERSAVVLQHSISSRQVHSPESSGWTGSLVLSRQVGGFEGVALVMTGISGADLSCS